MKQIILLLLLSTSLFAEEKQKLPKFEDTPMEIINMTGHMGMYLKLTNGDLTNLNKLNKSVKDFLTFDSKLKNVEGGKFKNKRLATDQKFKFFDKSQKNKILYHFKSVKSDANEKRTYEITIDEYGTFKRALIAIYEQDTLKSVITLHELKKERDIKKEIPKFEDTVMVIESTTRFSLFVPPTIGDTTNLKHLSESIKKFLTFDTSPQNRFFSTTPTVPLIYEDYQVLNRKSRSADRALEHLEVIGKNNTFQIYINRHQKRVIIIGQSNLNDDVYDMMILKELN